MAKKVNKKGSRRNKMPKYREQGGIKQITTYGMVLVVFLVMGIWNRSLLSGEMLAMFGVLIAILIYSILKYTTRSVNPTERENYEKFISLVEEDDNFDYDYCENKTEEELYGADDEEIEDDDLDEEDDIEEDE